MSEALQISKYSPSLVDTLSAKSVKDLKKDVSDTFKVQEQCFKTRRLITSDSNTLGTDQVFSIPNSYGYVSHFYLSITGSSASLASQWAAVNLIRQIKVEIGSEIMCTYTGQSLAQMLWIANRASIENAWELRRLTEAGGAASGNNVGVTVANLPLIIPIICPGSNGIYTLDAFDQRSPAFPLGACNSPMVITVTMQTGALAFNVAYVMTNMQLGFFSYAVDESRNIANKEPGVGGVYYSWVFTKPVCNSYRRVWTAATPDQFTIDNVITQGELDSILIMAVNSTREGTFDHMAGDAITSLQLLVRGTEVLYQHQSENEGCLNFLRDFKIKNKLTDFLTAGGVAGTYTPFGWMYGMSLTNRPDVSSISGNIGTKGINLNLNKPTILCTPFTTSGATTNIIITALYKALYNVNQDKTAKTIISAI